ncbi:MAG: chromosome segregation SMC family protein, partial [Candidatus Parvarchaeota archaeon]
EQKERSIKGIEQSLISYKSNTFEYSKAVEVAKKLSASITGVYGTLSQLIMVKNPSHSEAVFSAIGRRADFIVVDTEDTASKSIDILKENKLGSFSFIPLNKIIYFPIGNKPAEKGVVDYLINLVEYDQKFEGAVKFALSDTLLFDSFQNAKQAIGRYRMVTLDGTVFEKNGVISGGSYKRSDILSVNRTISNLTDELERAALEKNRLSEQLVKKEGELNFLLSRINYSDGKLKEIEAELGKTRSSVKTLSGSEAEISSRIAELEERRAKLLESIRMIEEPAAEQKDYKGEINILDKEIKEMEIRIASSSNKIENILKFELSNTVKRLQEISKEKSKFESELSELDRKLEELKKELVESKKEMESKSNTLVSLRRRREELISELTKVDRQAGELNQEDQKLISRLNELNLEKTGINVRLETVEEELKSYDISGIEIDEKEDIQSVQARLNSITRKVDNFGPINELAVSKYEEALQKFNENKAQLDVLNGEKQKLLDVIRDIDQKKLQALMETLNSLNGVFDKTFNFVTGGHASLVPENPDDVFGNGLDIRVDLPNKNVRSILGLSGGEQSIVAICLLLAMSKLTGSQFYILDEVDAALDSVNASKFSSLLRNFAEGAQFIIISHNDTTILNVDRAYGVYMDDSGISRAVSIDINEIAKQKAQ